MFETHPLLYGSNYYPTLAWIVAGELECLLRYIQKALDANISLAHFITLACLVWTWTRKDAAHSSG